MFTIISSSGNTASLIYFSQQRKDLPTKIYIMMSATDTVTSLAVIPTAASFLSLSRFPLIFQVTSYLTRVRVHGSFLSSAYCNNSNFQDDFLCFFLTALWAITPYFSVFLVLVGWTVCIPPPQSYYIFYIVFGQSRLECSHTITSGAQYCENSGPIKPLHTNLTPCNYDTHRTVLLLPPCQVGCPPQSYCCY